MKRSRIDAHLQLKTSPSAALRGKILIDSPGFDADAQRTSTLKITDHIIDLSDLVLVFSMHATPSRVRCATPWTTWSARRSTAPIPASSVHPQPDRHHGTRGQPFEEVVAAWQRAPGERGLTAGALFSPFITRRRPALIADEALRRRFEEKRDADLSEIHERMAQVEIERAYRIVGSLEKTARSFEEKVVPALDRYSHAGANGLIGDAIMAALPDRRLHRYHLEARPVGRHAPQRRLVGHPDGAYR